MENKKRWFAKGDYHGNFAGLKGFCAQAETTTDDILIVLGDAGLNYDAGAGDLGLKRSLTKLPITLALIHGNHELRPYEVPGYKLIDSPFGEGKVWHDIKFPNQFFLDDGEHIINGKSCLVLSGAYSVDKFYRLMNGYKWFESEQMDDETKAKLLTETIGKHFNYIFSHTCPTNYIPRDMFLSGIDQNTVDRSMEDFLQVIFNQVTFDKAYCGHWHTDRMVDNFHFVYHDYKEIYYEG